MSMRVFCLDLLEVYVRVGGVFALTSGEESVDKAYDESKRQDASRGNTSATRL